jgi:hypothetical protein
MSYRISDPTASAELVTAALRVGLRTFTSDPAEIFASGSRLAGRRRVAVHNLSDAHTLLCGVSGTNLQRDGKRVEPGERCVMALDPAVDLPVYACSSGAPAAAHVEEN